MLTPPSTGANVRGMPETGLQLKLKRVARRVRVTDLARAMGVTHGRVSQIEALDVPTAEARERYLSALATFPDVDPRQEVAS